MWICDFFQWFLTIVPRLLRSIESIECLIMCRQACNDVLQLSWSEASLATFLDFNPKSIHPHRQQFPGMPMMICIAISIKARERKCTDCFSAKPKIYILNKSSYLLFFRSQPGYVVLGIFGNTNPWFRNDHWHNSETLSCENKNVHTPGDIQKLMQ